MNAWTCHAIPAATGKTCGHRNADGGVAHRAGVACSSCGCMKVASDARRRARSVTVSFCVTRDGDLVELDVTATIAGSLDIHTIVDAETGKEWAGKLTDREESKLRDRICEVAS